MSYTVQFQSHVGRDGLLAMHLPDDIRDADVLVTIEPLPTTKTKSSQGESSWHAFVERTYGSCRGMGLERPPQPQFPVRELS